MERITIVIALDWEELQYVWVRDGTCTFSATPDPLARHVAQHVWNLDRGAARTCVAHPHQTPEFLAFDHVPALASFNGRPHPDVRMLTQIEREHFAMLVWRHLREFTDAAHPTHEIGRYSFTES